MVFNKGLFIQSNIKVCNVATNKKVLGSMKTTKDIYDAKGGYLGWVELKEN